MMFGWKTSIAMAAACAVGVVGGATYAKATRPEYVMVAAGASKFSPLDPANPAGVQLAVLAGDIKTGPVAIELKLPKGGPPVHWHTSDYYAMTLEGNTKHWLPGKEGEARSNPPGTFWFQPGGATGAHGDECLSDSCRVFVFFPGKFDFTPAAAPVKK
jgi:hypothetical protein